MGHSLIFQIGRLDGNAFQEQKFLIWAKEYENSLSSFAIKDAIESGGDSGHVFLFYPVSLPFNKNLLGSGQLSKDAPPEFLDKISEALSQPKQYLEHPTELFAAHPHTHMAENHRIIHSIGTFETTSSESPTISLDNCHYSDIVLEILLDVVNAFETQENVDRLIFDISSGHNIYVSALLEAARYFSVWLNLRYLGKPESVPSVDIAFSDPIISIRKAFKVHFEKLSIKAFFDSPVSTEDVENFNLSRAIFPDSDHRSMKRHLQDMLERFVLGFSAVKNNIPLFLYHIKYDSEPEIKDMLAKFIEWVSVPLFEKYSESPNLDKARHLKVLLGLVFYLGLLSILRDNDIFECRPTEGVDLEKLRDSCGEIYSVLGLTLNNAILGNEVDQFLKEKDKIGGEWMRVLSLLPRNEKKSLSPNKRNFFAHAGLESHITECRMQGDQIYVRYDTDHISTIRNWLIATV